MASNGLNHDAPLFAYLAGIFHPRSFTFPQPLQHHSIPLHALSPTFTRSACAGARASQLAMHVIISFISWLPHPVGMCHKCLQVTWKYLQYFVNADLNFSYNLLLIYMGPLNKVELVGSFYISNCADIIST